jgi:hypothetical protein
MFDTDEFPLWVHLAALAAVLAPTLALLVTRRRIGPLNTASGLVIWGAFVACGEHGYWAMKLAPSELFLSEGAHAGVHYFMAGVYAALAGVLLGVIAFTLLREHRRSGWFTVLFILLVGGSLELVMNGPTGRMYQHIGIYGYTLAWLAALVVAYKPVFLDTDRRSGAGAKEAGLRDVRAGVAQRH